MAGRKNISKKGSKKNNKKPVIYAVSALIVVLVIIILYVIIHRENEKISKVEYGVPVDYEEKGYIKLGKYKNISYSVEVTDEDVAEEIEYILEDAGTAKEGDMVNIDYKCTVDGNVIDDYTSENEYTTLGDEDYFAEFDEQIPGMNTGESKTITIEIPEDYGDELLDGKTAEFYMRRAERTAAYG